jgi:methylated-DNA-[protein]-cysteine S-methyltransferase
MGKVMEMLTAYYTSPIGIIEMRHSGKGISTLIFKDEKVAISRPDQVFEEAIRQLKEYFDGTRTQFDIPLDMKGTEFQLRVWNELVNIGYGRTATYSMIAKKLGDLRALRAVGKANGSNPVSMIVPCHRVTGSDGSLIGYAGGLWRKKWLLDHEQKHEQLNLF